MVVSGSKRKNPGKATKPPGDFKRLKSKVGKKGTKASNETDTKFQKASLHVAGQSIRTGTKSADTILSARGKSIMDLSVATSHHSGSARNSAIKGFINIMKEHSAINLRPHLYILLQAASKALVDEEHDVRISGYLLLEQILSRYDRSTLAPFISLLVAYTRSALHSLDSEMRFDGAKVVDHLSSFFRSMMSEYALSLLPPFVNLLSDRDKSKDLMSLLGSLVSLLSVLPTTNESSFSRSSFEQADHQIPFLFMTGGRSTNSFIQQRRTVSHLSVEFDNLGDVLTTSKFGAWNEKYSSTTTTSMQVLREIQMKLCNLLIEILQEDREEQSTTSRIKFSLPETKAAVIAIHLVSNAQNPCHFADLKQKEHLFTRTAKLLVEFFPVITDVPREDTVDDPDSVNAWITRTVLALVLSTGFQESMQESNAYIDKLFAYWIDGASGRKRQSRMSTTQVDIIVELLQALSSQRMKFSALRTRIHRELYLHFFREPNREVARSLAGRKAATLLANECLKQSVQHGQEALEEQILVDSVKTLPFYLHAWSADFEDESYLIIKALRRLAGRRLNPGDDGTLQKLGERVALILERTTAQKSIFEEYPLKLQRNFLGLIRILGNPSMSVLRALATICASSINGVHGVQTIGDEVFGSVYSVRKNMPMSEYLRFVISSIGVPRNLPETSALAVENELESSLLLLDRGLSRGSKAAIECGSIGSLRMLMPQLLGWLGSCNPKDPTTTSVIKDRSSVCMLSMLLLDMRRASISFETLPGFTKLLSRCIEAGIDLMLFLSKNALPDHLDAKLLAPFVVLANSDQTFAESLLGVFSNVRNEDITIQTGCVSDDERVKLSSVLNKFKSLLHARD